MLGGTKRSHGTQVFSLRNMDAETRFPIEAVNIFACNRNVAERGKWFGPDIE